MIAAGPTYADVRTGPNPAAAAREAGEVPPVFMFGFERSGTTLLSMIVGAHPDIAVPFSVTGMWYRYWDRIADYGHLRTRDDLVRMVADLLGEERIQLWDARFSRDEILADLEPGSFAAVVDRFHSAYARAKGKAHWANLDIATLDRMDSAHAWFPRARFIHIVRDGRDIALSHETMPYGAANVLEAAEAWSHRLQVNLKMGAILGPARYLVVRYEDLVLDTEPTLRRMCEFMGVPYAEQMMKYTEMVEEKVPEDRRWLWPALDKPPVKDNAYRWKSRMGDAKRIVFEGAGREMLAELGYEVYESVPKRPAAYALELWCLLNRGGRFARLARRFGVRSRSKLERDWQRKRKSRDV